MQVDNVRHVKGVCNLSVGTDRVNGANAPAASFISSFSRLLSLYLSRTRVASFILCSPLSLTGFLTYRL